MPHEDESGTTEDKDSQETPEENADSPSGEEHQEMSTQNEECKGEKGGKEPTPPRRRQKGDGNLDILRVEDVPTRVWFIIGASFPIFLVMVWYFWAPFVFTPAAEYLGRLYYFGLGKKDF
jgi:hypothetical protein